MGPDPISPTSPGEWLVDVCCRTCGARIEAPLSRIEGEAALACPTPDCGGHAALPADLAETARYLFEETRRRMQDAG